MYIDKEMISELDDEKLYSNTVSDYHGYMYKSVTTDNTGKNVIDIQLHGLLKKYGKIDLQIIAVDDPDINVDYILNKIIFIIPSHGKKLSHETESDIIDIQCINNVLINYDGLPRNILIKPTMDKHGSLIYRIIIPDNMGKYPWDNDCDERYTIQWTDKDIKNNNILINNTVE